MIDIGIAFLKMFESVPLKSTKLLALFDNLRIWMDPQILLKSIYCLRYGKSLNPIVESRVRVGTVS